MLSLPALRPPPLVQRVIGSIDVATRVMDELSNIANPNKQLIAQLCAAFFQDIKVGRGGGRHRNSERACRHVTAARHQCHRSLVHTQSATAAVITTRDE